MNIKELLQTDYFQELTTTDNDRKMEHVQICDLLSWVMRVGKERDLWITVQTHLNIIAVASLLEFSAIVVPSSIEVPAETIEKANRHGVCILSSNLSPYQISKLLLEMGLDHETLL